MANSKKTKTTKRTTTTTSGTNDIVKICAYWGLVISAIAAILNFVFRLLCKLDINFSLLSKIAGICSTVSQIALIVGIVIPAYRYCHGKKAVYRAFFWVAIIFIILGLVGFNLI